MMIELRFSLKDKLTIMIAAVIFVCIGAMSLNFYFQSEKSLMDSIRAELKDMAFALSLSIDSTQVEKVVAGTDKDPSYWALKRQLNGFTHIGEGKVHGAYILVPSKEKNIWLFVADDELVDKNNMVGLREKYEVSKMPDLTLAITGPTADRNITVDKWGRWLSGYAPLYNEKNQPIGVFGIDMRAADVSKLQQQVVNNALLYLLAGILLALILGRIVAYSITGPIAMLMIGVKEMKSKRYGMHIDVNRNDEIGDLVRVFNEMSDRMSEVDKIKTDFLSVISHELYTPLTPIEIGAEQLKTIASTLTQEFQQIIDVIDRQAKKMKVLIDEVLDFSWIDLKDLKLNKEPASIGAIAEEVIGELKNEASKKAILLDPHVASDLPTIMVDKKRIAHVIKIMLDNAIKFSADNSPVSIRINKSSEGISVQVEDRGVGIEPENLERIFERFYQVENHMVRTHPGLGLGLAMAKRIIEAHGGIIRAESDGPGKGSRFTFSLPTMIDK